MAKKKSFEAIKPLPKNSVNLLQDAQKALVPPAPRFNRFGRTYKGLDCSGKSKVLPPSFEGVRALVNKVGESAAYAAFPNVQEPEKSTIEEDIVLDFIDDLNHASDKVERLTLLDEFSGYLEQVKNSLSNPQPQPEPKPSPEPEPQRQDPPGDTSPQGGAA